MYIQFIKGFIPNFFFRPSLNTKAEGAVFCLSSVMRKELPNG